MPQLKWQLLLYIFSRTRVLEGATRRTVRVFQAPSLFPNPCLVQHVNCLSGFHVTKDSGLGLLSSQDPCLWTATPTLTAVNVLSALPLNPYVPSHG